MTTKNHLAAVSRRSFLKNAATGGALLAGAGTLPAGTLAAAAAGSETGPAARSKADEEPVAAVLRACGSEFGALRHTD